MGEISSIKTKCNGEIVNIEKVLLGKANNDFDIIYQYSVDFGIAYSRMGSTLYIYKDKDNIEEVNILNYVKTPSGIPFYDYVEDVSCSYAIRSMYVDYYYGMFYVYGYYELLLPSVEPDHYNKSFCLCSKDGLNWEEIVVPKDISFYDSYYSRGYDGFREDLYPFRVFHGDKKSYIICPFNNKNTNEIYVFNHINKKFEILQISLEMEFNNRQCTGLIYYKNILYMTYNYVKTDGTCSGIILSSTDKGNNWEIEYSNNNHTTYNGLCVYNNNLIVCGKNSSDLFLQFFDLNNFKLKRYGNIYDSGYTEQNALTRNYSFDMYIINSKLYISSKLVTGDTASNTERYFLHTIILNGDKWEDCSTSNKNTYSIKITPYKSYIFTTAVYYEASPPYIINVETDEKESIEYFTQKEVDGFAFPTPYHLNKIL